MVDSFRPSKTTAFLLVLLAAAPLVRHSATGVVGGLGSAWIHYLNGVTLIDFSRPATAAGSYDSATVYWVAGTRRSLRRRFQVEVLPAESRRIDRPHARGHARAVRRNPGLVTVTLHPPVSLLKGDLLALTELLDASCGAVALNVSGTGTRTVGFFGDDPGATISTCGHEAFFIPEALGAIATAGGTEVRSGIVTGVGSVHGASNSSFKTGTQIFNPGSAPISGRLVFHPIGQPGSSSDPSLPYSIPSFQATSIADLVGAIGTTGLGSIDVIANASYAPLIATHVFNDAGDAGTAGFTEPPFGGDQYVLEANEGAFLFARGSREYRMNVGVRSLAENCLVNIVLTNSTGGFKRLSGLCA
jgi:hypothetical protein